MSDDFNRPDATGLGASSEGWEWTSGITGWEISDNQAVASFTSANQVRRISVFGNDLLDSDVLAAISPSVVPTGGGLVTGVHSRYQDAQNYYWFQLVFETSGQLTLKITREVNDVYSEIATLTEVPGASSYTGGELWCMRASTAGMNLAVKVWRHGEPEPPHWHLQVADDSLLTPGRSGFSAWLLSGNTNDPRPTVHFDDLVIRAPIFYGEISSWPTRWDISGNDQWTPVTASGILRRLEQGRKPVTSPIFRNLSRYSPTGYWPMEDGADSSAPASGIAGQTPGIANAVTFGEDGNLPGASTVARLESPASFMRLYPQPVGGNTGWSFVMFFKLDSLPGSETTLVELASTGTVVTWRFSVDSLNYRWTALNSSGSTVFTSAGNYALVPPTNWIALHLEVTQLGGNVEFRTHWNMVGDPNFYNPLSIPQVYAGSIGSPTKVQIGPTALAPTSIGHVAVYGSNVPFVDAGFLATSSGYAGETAGNRMLRLAAEQGISVGVAGDPDRTEPLGRQRAKSFLELVEECASVDGGILYESRAGLGLVYRTRTSLYNRQGLELSYASGQVSEPFEPTEDDANTRNDVTVTRESGSSSRFALESGPLSIQAPPDGVGPYEESVTLNLHQDSQTANQASWRVHQGTVDEARYPTVSVNLAAPGFSDAALVRRVAALDSGDFMAVVDTPEWLPPGPTSVMVRGYSQHLDAYERTITFNAIPGSPWRVAEADGTQRVPADGTVVAAALSEASTSVVLGSTASNGRWTTDPVDFPQDVLVGGELVTVSMIEDGAVDTFDRTLSGSWGSTESGQAWQHLGTSSAFRVGSDAGWHLHTALNTGRHSMIDIGSGNVDFVFAVSTPQIASGIALTAYAVARIDPLQDMSNCYQVRCAFLPDGRVTCTVRKRENGIPDSKHSVLVPDHQYAINQLHWVRMRVEGALIQGKVWPAGRPEPRSWMASWIDPEPLPQSWTRIGITTLTEPASTNVHPIEYPISSFQVLNPQRADVVRGVNGVQRAWPVNTPVQVAQPAIAPL
ncbi:hypothetical protein [Micromonospora sp. NPDC049891]|uniref:hypothetical protein n=1 Tax=Micromonospora sp. NPDC049891 TaxID=3155655 RepID=UPI0033C975E6